MTILQAIRNQTEHDPNRPHIPNHPYRILIIGSGSGKTNALLNLISYLQDIDKIYQYAEDPYEPRYQLLIKKREDAGIKHYYSYKSFHGIFKHNNINDYNPNTNRKILIVFNDSEVPRDFLGRPVHTSNPQSGAEQKKFQNLCLQML